jgi:uncharacterized protein with NRDE domain
MCLIAFAWNAHPRWPLVLCANRDEFHARPTAELGVWREPESDFARGDAPQVIGGRDLQEGGGWLALNTAGHLAAVTNVREPGLPAAARSRGELVRHYLLESPNQPVENPCAVSYADLLRIRGDQYGPFNLLLWDGLDLVHASNRPVPAWTTVPRGVHSLSNGTLNSPWPKSQHLATHLEQWLHTAAERVDADGAPDPTGLFEALADRNQAADALLPNTGVGLERERLLSPPFIVGEQYGTRASSVVIVDRQGRARFIERRFGPAGRYLGEQQIDVQIAPRRA